MSELGRAALAAAERRAATSARAELRARGVVPTPLPVAQHALRWVDRLLRTELGVADGLASERVIVIDPAVGTGVWLAALLDLTRARGAASELIGFDTDAPALAEVATLLAPEAAAQGSLLTLRCANTLELATPFPDDDRVRVIVGNPPWAARSLSRGGALSDAWLAEFRHDHLGVSLGERRSGVLSDDYVRFFRWSLEHARSARAGALVCLATNSSFLDGPVHRGMRAALSAGFDRLEVLDLGGNALLSRAGGRDDNVFGVRVGAALTCAVRRAESARGAICGPRVSFGALRGRLVDKLGALGADRAPTLEPHTPGPPWFLFRPQRELPSEQGFSLDQAFPFHREGVQTNRDALATATSHEELHERLLAIERGSLLLTPLRHFDPVRVRSALARARERGDELLGRLSYRPFDERWFVTLAPLCHRPRPELQRAAAHSRVCLLAVRKDRGAAAFNLFASARSCADACYLSTRSSCRTRVFPSHTPDGSANLSPGVADELARLVGRAVTSSEVVLFALSVLGSPRYRARHQEALRLDYARLPWPRDVGHFEACVAVGRALDEALHELPPTAPDAPFALAPGRAADEPLYGSELTFDRARGQLLQGGRVLVVDVGPGAWDARVGQHRLLTSALAGGPEGARTVADLCAALVRAVRWVSAEAQADALHGEPAR